MIFLDFLYIVCCDYYKKNEPDLFKFSGLLLLTLVFLLNVILCSILLYDFKIIDHDPYKYRYYWIGINSLVIFLFLYLRYYKVINYEDVNNKSFSLSEGRRNRYYRLAILYILLSICSTFGVAIYNGGKVNGWWG